MIILETLESWTQFMSLKAQPHLTLNIKVNVTDGLICLRPVARLFF